MSSRHHIDDFMRGRIIGKIEEDKKITDVAREFDIAHSVVSRLWKSFKTTGMCSRRHGEVVLEVQRLQELWFQQDGATCHTARATIDLLKDTFGDRLISRFGPVNWPPRSCDLTPLDYFLWD
ncbi:uncharacterized protein TNCV_3448811 [Trichonephila clavipes]|nr:uncharacterized protein TNCV_3448811 [Trichonephila clavipes]